MKISHVNSKNMQTQMQSNTLNSATKAIQTKLARAEKQLNDLPYNQKMSVEEREKKIQEVQKEIQELHRKLKQQELEEERRKQKEDAQAIRNEIATEKEEQENRSKEDNSVNIKEDATKSIDIMKPMVSAEALISSFTVQRDMAVKMQNQANILKTEIKLDQMHGIDTTAKEKRQKELEMATEYAIGFQTAKYEKKENKPNIFAIENAPLSQWKDKA